MRPGRMPWARHALPRTSARRPIARRRGQTRRQTHRGGRPMRRTCGLFSHVSKPKTTGLHANCTREISSSRDLRFRLKCTAWGRSLTTPSPSSTHKWGASAASRIMRREQLLPQPQRSHEKNTSRLRSSRRDSGGCWAITETCGCSSLGRSRAFALGASTSTIGCRRVTTSR